MVGGDALMDLYAQGMEAEEVIKAFGDISSFEKTYAKYLDYYGKYSQMEFGATAELAKASYVSLDELCAAYPNFLDHMTLNVLEPAGSYYDYSELELKLTPTDQGGTLLGNYLKLRQYRLDQESELVGQLRSRIRREW